ncbi:BSD domain-containing protein 1-like [Zingiber officinale]|uniref:BSD domain-containing protein n=1 Tax=Zingiber officinale TaxID=94328 RepID=A0A8J5GRT2_ZINOF|nr:BSD domain-containing protein 1-like [Zingiber officinale]KAG6508755.1 hypothetical protein ZIOFF_034136 [Zingiber officinale]
MDFFRSVFSADADLSTSQTSPRVDRDGDYNARGGEDAFGGESRSHNSPENDVDDRGDSGGWIFGGLIETFASKSESIIQTYRRDLAEFSSGLKEETSVFREIAARAVRDLPGSLGAGASLAQESLESVGEAIDDLGGSVWRGTAGIISQSREAILSLESGADSGDESSSEPRLPASSAVSSRIYSRYEMLLLAMQSDVSTFTEDPEDTDNFSKWRSEFDLASKAEEMENLCNENDTLDGFLNKLVPSIVDYNTFWCHYFYKAHKLKQAEDARAKLVKRVISREAEEDLSWDVDDEDEEKMDEKLRKEENPDQTGDVNVSGKPEEEKDSDVQLIVDTSTEKKSSVISEDRALKGSDVKVNEKEISTSNNAEESKLIVDSLTSKLDETVLTEGKTDSAESSKDSEFSIISSQNSIPEEDDLGWDEIEDLPEDEEKKPGGSNVTLLKVNLHKRLSAAEEDEDLSWDIKDDDEPIKP